MESPTHTQDPLDQEIEAKAASVAAREAELAEMQRALDMERVELSALRRAASLRPAKAQIGGSAGVLANSVVVRAEMSVRRTRGKAPGTLSNQWRSIMAQVVTNGNIPLMPEAWARIASQCGYKLEVKGARDWLRRAAVASTGYINRDGEAYRVSKLAIDKFGLTPRQLMPMPIGPYATDIESESVAGAPEEVVA